MENGSKKRAIRNAGHSEYTESRSQSHREHETKGKRWSNNASVGKCVLNANSCIRAAFALSRSRPLVLSFPAFGGRLFKKNVDRVCFSVKKGQPVHSQPVFALFEMHETTNDLVSDRPKGKKKERRKFSVWSNRRTDGTRAFTVPTLVEPRRMSAAF